MNKKIGLVLEGGGHRGIYTAGLLDVFLENKISFDAIMGVFLRHRTFFAPLKDLTKVCLKHKNLTVMRSNQAPNQQATNLRTLLQKHPFHQESKDAF